MPKPFDASPKALVQMRPADWPAFLGIAAEKVEVKDADVSTVTAATDKVLLLHSSVGDRVQHYDFQSGPDASVPRRTHWYNSLLEERHQLPVDSIVILLRREANLKAINGTYTQKLPAEKRAYLTFRYRVIRVWELEVETILKAGTTVLPLAPISDVRKNELPSIIERIKQRLEAEEDQTLTADLWTAVKVLMGLRYEASAVENLLQGVRSMKESTTYQAILEEGRTEGRVEGILATIKLLGEDRWKKPAPPSVISRLTQIKDVGELEKLSVRVLHTNSWDDLLPPQEQPVGKRSSQKKSK